MSAQYVINALMSRYNVSWEVAYKAAWNNEYDYMMAAGEIRDMIANGEI